MATREELNASISDPNMMNLLLAKKQAEIDAINEAQNEQIVEATKKSLLLNCSVNQAVALLDINKHLVLSAEKKNTSQVAGAFVGGGSGNKPIMGIVGFEGKRISELPKILAEVQIRTRPTGIATDQHPDERQDGLSFNVIVDLEGNSNPADYKLMVITNTLLQSADKYGFIGGAASVTEFDINGFEVKEGFVSGDKNSFLKNTFHFVSNLPSYVSGTNFRLSGSGAQNSWTSVVCNLNCLLNGGIMPLTGATFSRGYPNAKIVSAMAFDGGQPKGVVLPGLMAQIGDSGTSLKSVTAVTKLTLNGEDVLY